MATKKKKKIDVSKANIKITIDDKVLDLTEAEARDLYNQLKNSLGIFDFTQIPYTPIDEYPDWTKIPWVDPIMNPTITYETGDNTKTSPLQSVK